MRNFKKIKTKVDDYHLKINRWKHFTVFLAFLWPLTPYSVMQNVKVFGQTVLKIQILKKKTYFIPTDNFLKYMKYIIKTSIPIQKFILCSSYLVLYKGNKKLCAIKCMSTTTSECNTKSSVATLS